jgi:hypothetical protein
VAHAAWFYCRLDPDAHRALALATAAAARAPHDPYVMRVLGWAEALGGDANAAIATLRPLADTDVYAAYQLAKLLRESGNATGAPGDTTGAAAAAAAVLDPWHDRPVYGPAADLLAELTGSTSAPASQPTSAPNTPLPLLREAPGGGSGGIQNGEFRIQNAQRLPRRSENGVCHCS